MASRRIPVFINGLPVTAVAGTPLSRVLADHDPELLATVLDPQGGVTDARGLPVAPDAPVHAGAIYRIRQSARRQGGVDV